MVDYRAIALTIWCVVYGVPLEESQNFVNFQTFQSVLDQKNYAVLQRNAVVNLTDLGGLQGSVDKTKWSKKAIYQFLGVKYAESPSGNRRFKAPVPVRPWQGIRSAEKYGASCPTYERLANMTESERRTAGDIEDCLNLDIYTKKVDEDAMQAVMVYVHGGSFIVGTSSNHPPNYLLESDIVLVVVEYRLDALGFLSTMTREIPGNAGLMDVIGALEFVQKHIVKFGGDPSRVTLVGQSAGAAMVSQLGMSPSVSPKLFNRIIVQSGAVYSSWSYALNPVENAKDIGQRAGVPSRWSISQLNRAFIAMDVFTLLNATESHYNDNFVNGVNTVGGRSLTAGGPLMPETPINSRRKGLYRKDLAVLAGVTKDDGTFLTATIYDILASKKLLQNNTFMKHHLVDMVLRVFGDEDEAGDFTGIAMNSYWTQEEILRGDFRELATGISDLVGTIALKAPILRLIRANALYNPQHTYLYSFDYLGEHTRYGYGKDTSHYPFDGGIHHSNDNIYIYPWPPHVANLNDADAKMSKRMVQLWTSFVMNGVPELNDTSNFDWLPVTNVTGPFLHIDNEFRMDKDFTNEFFVRTREKKSKQL